MQGQYHDGVHFTQKSLQLSSPVPTYWPHIASLASVERCALENTCISSENRDHITGITSNCTKWRSQQWQTQHWHWTLRQVRVQVLAHKEGYSLSCTPTRTQFLPRRSSKLLYQVPEEKEAESFCPGHDSFVPQKYRSLTRISTYRAYHISLSTSTYQRLESARSMQFFPRPVHILILFLILAATKSAILHPGFLTNNFTIPKYKFKCSFPKLSMEIKYL